MLGWVAILEILASISGAPVGDHAARIAPEAGRSSRSGAIDGQVVLLADVLPRRDAAELRPSLLVEATGQAGRLRARAEVAVEGLVAARSRTVGAAAVRPRDVWVEVTGRRAEVRAGYGRVIWGRLDELQPTDVINPIDAARFLLDGRSEARLPVAFLRGRVFAGETVTVESVVVPWFRRGSFDQRDEETSPFNLVRDLVLPAAGPPDLVRHLEPPAAWRSVSGGARVSATRGRVDVGVAAFRGFDAFGPLTFEVTAVSASAPAPAVIGQLVERHPRFTMVGADFETVAGPWGVRGEAAAIVDRRVAGVTRPGLVAGRALDVGVGLDRSAGTYRLFASVLVHHEWSPEDPRLARTDTNLLGSIERRSRRERWLARGFAVVNPADGAGFLRGLVSVVPRDNVTVEVSAAAFFGTSDDTLGRFHGRDFVFGRVRYHF